jgi:hypothetical protein
MAVKSARYVRDILAAAKNDRDAGMVGPRFYSSYCWGVGVCCLTCRRHVTQSYAEGCLRRASVLPRDLACVYCSRIIAEPPPREGVDG